MHFGASLRLLRGEAGISLKTLASSVGVSTAYLSRVENGHDAPPTVDRLRAIADVFGVPVDLLIMLTGRARDDTPDRSLAVRVLSEEVARRRLGPAQVARILDFIQREFPETADRGAGIVGMLAPDRVLSRVRVGRVEDALDLAALRLAEPSRVATMAALLRAREQASSSAVGAGLLLPHLPGETRVPSACLVLLVPPCVAATPDGAPLTAVLTLTGIGEGPRALTLLARAARLADAELLGQLCATDSAADVLRLLALYDPG